MTSEEWPALRIGPIVANLSSVSQQNPQPTGHHARSNDPQEPTPQAGSSQPDVGSRLNAPVPATGVPDVSPSFQRSHQSEDSGVEQPNDSPGVDLLEDDDVVDREPAEQHGTAELGSEADSGDSSEFPSADLVYGRIPITDVSPVVECGRFPATAIPGEDIQVSATVFREGHDSLGASAVLYDPQGREDQRVTMTPGAPGTDTFHALLRPRSEGTWSFAIEGWSDLYDTWLHAAEIKIGVGQDVELMFKEGQLLFEAASKESSRSSEEARAFENASRSRRATRSRTSSPSRSAPARATTSSSTSRPWTPRSTTGT